MRSRLIVALGEILWDLLPSGARLGGAPGNFACQAVRQGTRTAVVSATGSDSRGEDTLRILQSHRVDTSLIARLKDLPTGTVGVQLDAQGRASYQIHPNAAWDKIPWSTSLEHALVVSDAVYFGILAQRSSTSRNTIRRALQIARSLGIPRILDVNLRKPFFDPDMIRESLELATVLKLSEEELPEVAAASGIAKGGSSLQTLQGLLQRHQLELAALTMGEEGALVVSREEAVRQPGIPVHVRDTIGAGDAFTAALVCGLLEENNLPTIALRACKAAAATCAHSGAIPDPPRWAY